jgi:hypothetical protein
MLERAITFLLQLVLALSLATFVLAWLAIGITVVAFIRHVYRATSSVDPLEWWSYLRAIPRAAPPAEIAYLQLWQRRVWRASVASLIVVLVSAVLLGVLRASFHV